MAVGFVAYNDAGYVQVDENYFNFALVQTADVWTAGRFTISTTTANPLLAFRCTGAAVAVLWATKSGNSWTFTCAASAATTATYYIFDQQPQVETRAGLNVYNSSGQVVFNSDYKMMRVVGYGKVDDGYGDGNGLLMANPQLTVGAGVVAGSGVYAACMMQSRSYIDDHNGNDGYFVEGVRISGGSAVVEMFVQQDYAPSGTDGNPIEMIINPIGGNVLLIDVNGY